MGDTDTLKDTWMEAGTPGLDGNMSVNSDILDKLKLREKALWGTVIGNELFEEHGTLFDDEQFMEMSYNDARNVAKHLAPQLVIDGGEPEQGPDLREPIFDLIDPRATDFPDLTATHE